MAYVRTLAFTVPAERTQELSPGHNLYLAAVHGTQIAAQNVEGYHKGGVWMQRQAEGSIKVIMFSQFNELDNLEAYANVPMVRDFESDVSKHLSPVVVEIYEVLA
jgi:antibiotic biosynthesis monooxygenase (ABM) superfamily enzyme